MELLESTEPYLSLNMIVKNEGHIIKDTLTKLLNKVPEIDYWVISDTGSTDETKKIISDFFKERNINGELFDDKWKDFGHNRTLALEHAFGKSKYLLVFDADDEICGDFVLPDLKVDSYNLQFGDANGTSYTRPQIVNNKKKWKYVGVLHEIITCCEHSNGADTIQGKYYTISGKSGDRSRDDNKYFKDALILEKAYEEAVKNNDELYNRYGFYCANSYYDSGKWEDAIKWYKITLNNKNWSQEKYVACQRLYNCYNALKQQETGLFYLVKSFSYDKERAECLHELVAYYCCNNMNEVAYSYYNIVKSFYNERYLKDGLNDKLFLDVSKANLFLPYYMILVSDKVNDHDTTIQMYRIIFTKKHIERNKHFIGNMLFNLQFFIERVKDDSGFLRLFQEYVEFLISINYPIYDHDFMTKYEKYGINVSNFSEPVFSLDDCLKSKNILVYSGYSPFKWNYTFSINNALGGSETAITCLTKNFPKDFTIYVAGNVEEETVENIRYVDFNNLTNLIKTTAFHSIIVSRYLNFYELYRNFSAYQTFIWGHDITLYAYGADLSVEGILSKWASKITGCICQTEWHKNLFLSSFPQLKDKISTINNGINADLFISKDITKVKKITNRFIYTSCSERGLYKLVQLWPSVLENLPDAELLISSYNNFPNSEEDIKILEIITKTPSIKHMGKLNRTVLYKLMATAEYWLYPSYFQETSCITSLELLASEVICLYYPIAGLVNTVGDYGIKISEGNEIDALLSLSIKTKNELKRKGKEYALSCSWQNRAIEWSELLFLHNDSLNITNDKNQLSQTEKRMFYLYESFSMPEAHIKMLKTISDSFTPKVIYDIGSNTLHWTKEAKNIWTNSEIFAFDAIQEAEELYKSKNVKYNIGVLSDLDNKIVKFYENKENPAGNSYYKEIGHPNSVNIFPEDSYSEKIAMTLETVVKRNNFLLPDLVKIDVQGAELDILKGGQNIINNAKYLIIELQNVEYNRGAPLENVTIDYLQSKGWEIVESKFSNNGPDADYLFINTNYTTGKILNNVFTIKIVNLERRSDRKTDMINKLSEKMVNNYEFFEAVDGNLLEPSQNIKNLFKNNNFNYRKGVIGCALSHYELWKNLINDDKYSYYVILEDDIELVDNFNEYIEQSISIIQKQDIKYALIGGYQIKDQLTSNDIISFDKITQPISSGTFGYIISKEGCKVLVNYLNKHGINTAIDYSELYTNCLDMYKINKYLVTARAYQIHGENDTDIQLDYNCLNFDSIPTFTVSFVDWWSEEYCGGTFDNHNNYFTNLLSDFYDIKVVSPEENPDILFYSVFGNNHLNLNAKRKIFYTGEPIPQDPNADFNITFDNDNDNNCRLPLWLSYLNDTIINDYNNKIQNKIEAPQKSKFCSIICQQDNVSNTRSEIVNKLSKYKRVDCGGKFLNNIGYVVPRGINCSGKIEHNTNYKFAITFENKEYPGYVTEKICDAYKSKCIPIYWGTKDVVKDFNPSTFINANNFANFDELIDYIIKVDNDDKLYKTFFKEPIFSNKWLETFNDINKLFFKNLADRIIGKNENLLNEYFNEINNNKNKQDEPINYNKKNDNFRNYIFQYGIDSNKKDVTDIIVNILESTMQNFVIPIGDNMRAQLFGDPCWGHVKNIYIYNKNYPEETIIVTENESKIIYFDEKYNYNFVMGFYDNGLSERGTTTMMFSYADYTEKYFKCKSIIFYNKHHHSNNNEVINRFSNRFDVYRVENFEEIDRIILDKNIKYLYNTCGGLQNSTPLVKNCKNLIHAVFQIEPFGDKYSAISDYIVKKSKFLDIEAIPYMIDLPIHNDNMRNELNLPDNAFVIGRIGGYEQFDIKEAHKGIINFLNNDNNNSTYFVFVNTQQFYEHPQIIYLDKIVEPYLKVKYINTCNCMIHARSDGETFGLAVGEFSSLNKPIITCRSYKDNCHLDILGEKAIIFDSETSLINILKDIKSIVTSRDDWNAYKEYTPDKVMKKFHKVFLPNEDFINICNNIKFYNITFDNINYEIIDIGNNQTSAIIKK
jgi:FkbM family methyltransferase